MPRIKSDPEHEHDMGLGSIPQASAGSSSVAAPAGIVKSEGSQGSDTVISALKSERHIKAEVKDEDSKDVAIKGEEAESKPSGSGQSSDLWLSQPYHWDSYQRMLQHPSALVPLSPSQRVVQTCPDTGTPSKLYTPGMMYFFQFANSHSYAGTEEEAIARGKHSAAIAFYDAGDIRSPGMQGSVDFEFRHQTAVSADHRWTLNYQESQDPHIAMRSRGGLHTLFVPNAACYNDRGPLSQPLLVKSVEFRTRGLLSEQDGIDYAVLNSRLPLGGTQTQRASYGTLAIEFFHPREIPG